MKQNPSSLKSRLGSSLTFMGREDELVVTVVIMSIVYVYSLSNMHFNPNYTVVGFHMTSSLECEKN